MTNPPKNYSIHTLIFGLLFFVSYFFKDYLSDKFWLLSFLLIGVLGLCFLISFFATITRKSKAGILSGILILGAIFATELYSANKVQSKKILEATLMDDLSAIHLYLHADSTFEVLVNTWMSGQTFKGKYSLAGNKIQFIDRPYDNDFIPDTVFIIGDKVILRFDKNGRPVTDFASYFKIHHNEIKSLK